MNIFAQNVLLQMFFTLGHGEKNDFHDTKFCSLSRECYAKTKVQLLLFFLGYVLFFVTKVTEIIRFKTCNNERHWMKKADS